MTVGNIIKHVRWCIDEEIEYSDFENTYMDNIIKSKMGDALRWCMLYAEGSLLGGSDETGTSAKDFIKTYTLTLAEGEEDASDETDEAIDTINITATSGDISYTDGVITLPKNCLKVVRVRNMGGDDGSDKWHRAIMNPISEDSEEYMMLSDETSKATKERPQAALIESSPQRLEIYPVGEAGNVIEVTLALDPDMQSGETTYSIPPKIKSAFLYYLAFLVLCAYNDTAKANSMLTIAKMELGITQK